VPPDPGVVSLDTVPNWKATKQFVASNSILLEKKKAKKTTKYLASHPGNIWYSPPPRLTRLAR